MKWLKEVFQVEKPIIAMCHLQALPGDPGYQRDKGIGWVLDMTRKDLIALQKGGVDGVMFSNEFSIPYLIDVEPVTYTTMARIIGELKHDIKIPFGVNVLWDPKASIDLAVATEALFVREIFTGVYASDFGLWNTNCGEVIRHQHHIGGEDIKIMFNIVPEAASYLGQRDIADIARSTVFNCKPDALCVSGLTAGSETDSSTLRKVKDAVPDTPVFANTGVSLLNVEEQLSIADGTVTATTFKRDGVFNNEIDQSRVAVFMDVVRRVRREDG
ncbi:MAG: BtpA/SgcQ family protein [Desulfobacterales bacterium]